MNRESGRPPQRVQNQSLALVIVWLIAAIYLALRAGDGWIPHDEGLLGQSAERVLAGELPHRDFDDPYTGGLACLHAFVFRLLGVDLYWLRLVLLAFSLVFVPALYSVETSVLRSGWRCHRRLRAALISTKQRIPEWFAPWSKKHQKTCYRLRHRVSSENSLHVAGKRFWVSPEVLFQKHLPNIATGSFRLAAAGKDAAK